MQAYLEAMEEYVKEQSNRYVICSRIEEYTQTADAPVYCQVMVKPLTLKQIKEGLTDTSSPEANGILDALKKDQFLAEAIKTPIYLNTAQLLFASMKSWKELEFLQNTVEGRKQEIIEKSIQYGIKNLSPSFSHQAEKWLSYLAYNMTEDQFIRFELIDLQYHWEHWRRTALIISIVISDLVNGLVIGMMVDLVLGLAGGLVGGVNSGLVFGPGLVLGLAYGLAYGLVGGLVFGLVLGLVYDLVFGLVLGLVVGWVFGLILSLILNLVYSLVYGLNVGLNVGLVGDLVGDLRESLEDIEIETRERIKFSIDYIFNTTFIGIVIMVGLIVYVLVLGEFVDLVGGLVGGSISILVLGLIDQLENSQSYLRIDRPYQRFYYSMMQFYFSILQHVHLRYLLYRRGVLPFQLVKFLNEATQNNLLESDGGSWRFRHKILQDYFAEQWKAKYATQSTKSSLKEV